MIRLVKKKKKKTPTAASALSTNDHDLGLKGSPTGRIFGTTKHNQTCSWDSVAFGVIAATTSSSPVATGSSVIITGTPLTITTVLTTTTATNNVLTTTATNSVLTTTTAIATTTTAIATTTTYIATTTSVDPAAQESSFKAEALKWDTELSDPDPHNSTFLSDDSPSTHNSDHSNTWDVVNEIQEDIQKYNLSSIPGMDNWNNITSSIDQDLTELHGLDPSNATTEAEWTEDFNNLENDFERLNNTPASAVFESEINTVESHKHDFDNATDVAGDEEKWKALLDSLNHEFNSTTPDSVAAALTNSTETEVKDEPHKFGIGFLEDTHSSDGPSSWNFTANGSEGNATEAAEYMAVFSNITSEYNAIQEKLKSGNATWQQGQEEWNEFLKNLEAIYSGLPIDLSDWIVNKASESDFDSFFNAIGANLTALENSPAMVVTSTSIPITTSTATTTSPAMVATSTSIPITTSTATTTTTTGTAVLTSTSASTPTSTANPNLGGIMLEDSNMVTSSSVPVLTSSSVPVLTTTSAAVLTTTTAAVVTNTTATVATTTSTAVITTTTTAPVATPSMDPNAAVTRGELDKILGSRFSSMKDSITSYLNSMFSGKTSSGHSHNVDESPDHTNSS
ncbi:hypothetical protein BC937DRAFT_95006 [Endogone sp. FLAS-F59071]|nr:hypothetical protein BC937DRAFT_95006 [Endogone sp. FLAS-F59071]|eukprot:RUS13643.1 hypothetical protein BC937DRAFT_95006 [Endogone sp. FLAS-F59071]